VNPNDLDVLNLPPRVVNALRGYNNIRSVAELFRIESPDTLKMVGDKGWRKIRRALARYNRDIAKQNEENSGPEWDGQNESVA